MLAPGEVRKVRISIAGTVVTASAFRRDAGGKTRRVHESVGSEELARELFATKATELGVVTGKYSGKPYSTQSTVARD